jgi:hypothetical protein
VGWLAWSAHLRGGGLDTGKGDGGGVDGVECPFEGGGG